jgi:hypothetical protein
MRRPIFVVMAAIAFHRLELTGTYADEALGLRHKKVRQASIPGAAAM